MSNIDKKKLMDLLEKIQESSELVGSDPFKEGSYDATNTVIESIDSGELDADQKTLPESDADADNTNNRV